MARLMGGMYVGVWWNMLSHTFKKTYFCNKKSEFFFQGIDQNHCHFLSVESPNCSTIKLNLHENFAALKMRFDWYYSVVKSKQYDYWLVIMGHAKVFF